MEEKPPAIAQRAALRCTVGIDPWLWPSERRCHSDYSGQQSRQQIWFL